MIRRVPRSARAALGPALAAGTLVVLALAARTAGAQNPNFGGVRVTIPVAELNVPPSAGALAQRPFTPLSGGGLERLYRAQSLRQSGRLAEARDTLGRMLIVYPHHPQVLAEIAHVYGDQQQWAAMERLARTERAAQRDSVLLGRELCAALARLGRPREGVQVAVEVWLAAPAEAPWAEATILRLDGLEPRTAREPLRRAAELRPDRADLVRAAARLEWRHGDSAAALRLLAAADKLGPLTPTRWSFAEDLLRSGAAPDSTAALDALLDLAHDAARDPGYRVAAARRAWAIVERQGADGEAAARVAHALTALPVDQWGADLGLPVIRALRQGGHTAEARDLLGRIGERRDASPGLALEGALNDLRDAPSEAALKAMRVVAPASPEASFRYAEALFFAGLTDSAAALYNIVSKDPKSPWTGASLERLYLIEDGQPRSALPAFGRLAYEQWRGEPRRASVLADSLYRALPHGPLWARAAVTLAELREATGDAKGALEPLLAVADSLPDDRLGPTARQRAGDVYRLKLKDDANALAQYEACLARYPRAWNAPEVRRAAEALRLKRRF